MRVNHGQNKYVAAGVVVVIVLLALGTGYYYVKYHDLKNSSTAANQATANKVIREVGKLYILPKGQTPTVARIVNVDKLKNQAFFRNADNNDQLLIYTKAQLAIIYRPSTNMIINAGPVALNNGTASTTSAPAGTTPTPIAPAKPIVFVLNGSTVDGEAATTGSSITGKFGSQVTVSPNYSNATVKEVKPFVVAVTASDASLATQIASYLGGTVGALPAGQTAPAGTNILVITGK